MNLFIIVSQIILVSYFTINLLLCFYYLFIYYFVLSILLLTCLAYALGF